MGSRLALLGLLVAVGAGAVWFAAWGDGARAQAEPGAPTATEGTPQEVRPDAQLTAAEAVPDPPRREVEEPAAESPAPQPPSLESLVQSALAELDFGPLDELQLQDPPGLRIAGRLRSQKGAWDDIERLLAGHVHIDLVSADERALTVQAQLSRREEASGEVVIAFEARVPEGSYDLTLSTTDHHRWFPTTMRVEAPVEDLEIWCHDDRDTIDLGFRVFDAETREPVEGFSVWSVRTEISEENGVLFHAGPLKLEGVPLDAPLTWRLWAPGYVPAQGDGRAFREEADGRWVAEVYLRAGWGRRFVALGRDPSMRPLAGARILVDGVEVGRTGPDGGLEVALEEPPGAVEASWGALALAPREVQPDGAVTRRAMISVLVLEPVPASD